MNNDPYKVLGVSPGATPEEIKKAYRAKTKMYHPDLHPDDPVAAAKMSEVNEAYDILTDPKKRSRYSYGNAGYGYQRNSTGQNAYGNRYGYSDNTRNEQEWSSTYWGFNFDDLFGYNSYQRAQQEEIRPENGDPVELVRAIRYINENRNEDALVILSNMIEAYRNARWYYINAIAYYNLKYYDNALEMIKQAVKLEPQNAQYSYLYQKYSNENRYHYSGGYSDYSGYTRKVISPFGILRKAVMWFIAFQIIMFILRLFLFGFIF